MSEETLDTDAQLKALLYQYVNLYERWSEDRQVFAKKGAELAQVLQDAQVTIDRLETLDEVVRSRVTEHLDALLPVVRETVVGAATDAVRARLLESAQRLEEVVTRTEKTLQRSLWEGMKSRLWWCGATLLGAVVLGVVVTKLLLPNTFYSLTPYQLNSMAIGQNLTGLLNRLSPDELKQFQGRVKALEKKHEKNEP